MHISRLVIRNYRNFRSAVFQFHKGINAIVGENGSGKTNALQAIRLLLDEDLPRRALRLVESDFNRALDDWRGHWVIISIDFDELDPSEGCQIIAHQAAHHAGNPQSGTYTFIFRPRYQTRHDLHELSTNSTREQVEQRLSQITLDEYEPILTGRATADFSDDAFYTTVVGNHETCQFPSPDDDDLHLLGSSAYGIEREISLTFAKALRDVVDDLRGYRDNPLLNLLRGAGGAIEVGDAEALLTQVSNLNSNISQLSEVRRIGTGLADTLLRTVGTTYAPQLDLMSSLPNDIESLLRRLVLQVGDPNDLDYRGDVTEISLGGANLLYLSLKLLEYEFKLATDRAAHFLLIEEPEAHIHTHVQKTLFDRVPIVRTQVIVSTHSTHLSAASRISRMNVLAQSERYAKVFSPSAGLTPEETARVERYLDAVRTTLLFAKSVMLVEGDAELILIPRLVREVLGLGLDELGISVISVDSSVFTTVGQLFDSDRIARRCAIVSDLDEAFINLPNDPNDDDDAQKKARASQESGIAREARLNGFCGASEYRSAFLANHTFEVDFIQAGNSQPAVAVLNEIYQRQADIIASRQALQSDDLAVAGTEILRLANKCGKGWFALTISRHVGPDTLIPDYILRALAFLYAQNRSDRGILMMVKSRLERISPDQITDGLRQTMEEAIRSGTGIEDALQAARQRLADGDQLGAFLGYVEGAVRRAAE